MSQPQTLNVEYDELMARAVELEAPIPGIPPGNPAPPCNIAMVVKGAQQLALSADNMRLYLGVGDRERKRLAESLRNAAKAYEEADEGAEEAFDNETAVQEVTPDLVDEGVDPSTLGETVSLMAVPDPVPYYAVRQAAQEIEAGDQGVSFTNFANAWEAYQRTLLEARIRFRPFQDWWNGTASDAVEANFDSQRGWLDAMATMCGTMATQARVVVTAHKWAITQHPTVFQINEVDALWNDYAQRAAQNQFPYNLVWPQVKPQLEQRYRDFQSKSEEVLTEYEKRAAFPLPPLSPPKPPPAYYIPPPPEPGSGDEPGPGDPGGIDPNNPGGELPDPGLELPDPTGMPAAGAGGGMPSTPPIPAMPDNSKLADALKDLKGGPPGAGMKPASLGGGKIGGGIPAMPMQPPSEAESSRPASAVPGAASMGRGVPIPAAGGAAGGGMGGGMAPMAPGQGQNAGKQGSRVDGDDDDSLYTEERAWTEGAIGIAGLKPPGTTKQ
jgi:hypothetical protein